MANLKRNALHMLNSQVAVTLCQGLQFVLVARALGATEFGRLAAILAISSVLVPFSGLGLHNVTTMQLARGRGDAPLYYGNSLLMGLVSGTALIVLTLVVSWLWLGPLASTWITLVFGLAEFLLTYSVGAASCVFYGVDQHRFASRFQSLLAFARLCSAGLFVGLHALGWLGGGSVALALIWGVFYLVGSLGACALIYRATVREIGLPRFHWRQACGDVRTGVFFAVGVAATSVYTDIDKTVLARVASAQINGAYTAAYRVIFMSYAPVRAVLYAMQARFFRDGALGVGTAVRSAARLAAYATGYCIVLALAVRLVAPLLPWILGKSYALSADVLGKLALLPLFLMLQDVFSTALTGADRQHLRSLVQVISAGICVMLNLTLAPPYGWQGSAVATYCTQILLAAMVIGVILYTMRAERKRPPNESLQARY